jgi:glutaminyl-peptide cyclotransferase
MLRKFIAILRPASATVLILGLCACDGKAGRSGAIDPQALDQEQALREVQRFLELGPRDAGTPGAERAAQYIAARLAELGVAAEIDSFEDQTPLGPRRFHNVVATIPGRGDGLVLLGSHFDTKAGMPEGFQGANDSGSSTGLLLELARVLKDASRRNYDMLLVFFDGEECIENYSPLDGLHGSRHLARQLIDDGRADDVKAVIIMDMVGDRDLDVRFPLNCSPALVSAAFQAARQLELRQYFGLSTTAIIDDHLPFQQAGMPTINFIDFNFGSRPGSNDYWHTAEDSFDKLSEESLGIVGRVVLELLNREL